MTKQELIESLKKLKAGYISILNDLEVMKNWGKVQLEALYATKIGKYEVELLELKILIKTLKKKIQWAHQEINSRKYPDFVEIENRASELMKEAYQEINEAKSKVNFGKAVLSNLGSPEDSMELRKIFRNIAKSLHPDINPNLTEEQQELWHLFHSAYKSGDLDKIKALEIVFEEQLKDFETSQKELSEEDILMQTAMLKQGILELESQKKDLENDFPFTIEDKIRDEDWVAEKQESLTKEIEELKEYLKLKEADYQLIKETYGSE